MMDTETLTTIREINRGLPFADPIAECATPHSVWILPPGSFDPAAPTVADLSSAIAMSAITASFADWA